MRKLLLGIALLATVATGCKKNDNNSLGGSSEKRGAVTLINNSENSYTITIHGDAFIPTIAGKSIRTENLAVGSYPLVATQKEGYTGRPNVVEETIVVQAGGNTSFTIP